MRDLLINRLIELGLPEQYSKVCLEELFFHDALATDSENLEALREAVADLLREVVQTTLPEKS